MLCFYLFCQIDDDFLAHYQLSYGFNSSDTTTTNVTNPNGIQLQSTTVIKNIKNLSEPSLNVSNENSETEKRKLPQPSEPSKQYFILF